MIAKHNGRCAHCGGLFRAGEEYAWAHGSGKYEKLTFHPGCIDLWDPNAPEPPSKQTVNGGRDAFPLFDVADCSSCGRGPTAASRAAGGLPAVSDCCGARWDRTPYVDDAVTLAVAA